MTVHWEQSLTYDEYGVIIYPDIYTMARYTSYHYTGGVFVVDGIYYRFVGDTYSAQQGNYDHYTFDDLLKCFYVKLIPYEEPKKSTEYYIIADTHFGHEKFVKAGLRPKGFEEKILKSLSNLKEEDILIHLGDFAFYNIEYWLDQFCQNCKAKKWLIKGNHDRKTDTYYLNKGFDFVADSVTLNRFGKNILLTHIPLPHIDKGYINVHGHLHTKEISHREFKKQTLNHFLVSCEDNNYQVQKLKTIIGK